MGARPQATVAPRVVFDTGVVVSALVFRGGQLDWLREDWQEGRAVPLLSRATANELLRVLSYPKFRLTGAEREELLAVTLDADVFEAANPNLAAFPTENRMIGR